jgi:hypothetical protein
MRRSAVSSPSSCRRSAGTTTVRLLWMGVGVGALAAVRNRYLRDLRQDCERLHEIRLTVLETPFGAVEYAEAGDGPPVLVVHGVLGGYDFGVGTGSANLPDGHRIIAPSAVRLSRIAVPGRSFAGG